MSKHTPGPWTYDPAWGDVISAKGEQIVSFILTDSDDEVADGNLIAAAPEMYEALKRFADMHREGTNPDEMACQRGTASDATYIFSGDFEKAAKAIAKAEGRS